MTIECYWLLHKLKKLTHSTEQDIFVDPVTPLFCIPLEQNNPNLCYDAKKYAGEVNAIVSYIVDNGYLVRSGNSCIRFTYKGLHPFKISLHELLTFVAKSIILPIVISAITTIITLRLNGLLQ